MPEQAPPLTRFGTLLKWSERYTKTDMSYLTDNGVWLVIAQVAIALIALLLSIAFARYVPKDVYGTYRFLLSLFWTLTALSLTGVSTVLARAVAKGKDGAWLQTIRLSLIWSWPMVLVSLGLSGYYYLAGNILLAIGALIIAVVGPLMQPTYLFGSYLVGKKRFRDNALTGIVLNLLPALALLATMFFSKNPLSYLAAYLGANVLTAALLSFFIYLRTKPNAEREPKLLNLGGHYSAMNILNTVASQIDRLVVYHYLGAVQLAVYAFATAMPDQIKNIFNNVSTLALPKFASRPLREIKRTLNHRLAGFTLLMVFTALAYILIAPLIFHYLFPAYSDAVFYSQLYAVALIPIGNMFSETLFQAQAAKKALYIFNVGSALFQIISVFVGIIFFGLVGVIVARIASRAFNLALGVLAVRFMPEAAPL